MTLKNNVSNSALKTASAVTTPVQARFSLSQHPLTTSKYGYQWSEAQYANTNAKLGFLRKIAAHQGVALTMSVANVLEFMMNAGLLMIDLALASIKGITENTWTATQAVFGRKITPLDLTKNLPEAHDAGKRLGSMFANAIGLVVCTRLFFGSREKALATAEKYKLKNAERLSEKKTTSFYETHKKAILSGLGVASVAVASYYMYTYGLPSISLPVWPLGKNEGKPNTCAADLSEAQKNLATIENDLESCNTISKNQILDLNHKAKEDENTIKSLKTQINDKETKIYDATQKLQENENTIELLKKQINDKETKIYDATQKLQENKNTIELLKKQINDKETNIDEIQNTLGQKAREYKNVVSINTALRLQLSDCEKALDLATKQ